ncbi:hypothetical protein RchiOBHm_Chr4g0398381 [Rosa chinensis]|uniref:Uncharacterized protein n=1 Tax=Rosa chinensis TaxID=74649 RepID=A0A2P6QS99_ROSCH|nr:hypothetical protein RchiOBHm_Chr4g0398381 [Rosa chinensis]
MNKNRGVKFAHPKLQIAHPSYFFNSISYHILLDFLNYPKKFRVFFFSLGPLTLPPLIGAVQLGVLAACVVVLVLMDMASYHLSHKMLFFSGALFITLAIGVHLTLYFPSVTSFVSTISSVVVFQNRCYSYLSHLHDLVWDVTPSPDSDPPPPHPPRLPQA